MKLIVIITVVYLLISCVVSRKEQEKPFIENKQFQIGFEQLNNDFIEYTGDYYQFIRDNEQFIKEIPNILLFIKKDNPKILQMWDVEDHIDTILINWDALEEGAQSKMLEDIFMSRFGITVEEGFYLQNEYLKLLGFNEKGQFFLIRNKHKFGFIF